MNFVFLQALPNYMRTMIPHFCIAIPQKSHLFSRNDYKFGDNVYIDPKCENTMVKEIVRTYPTRFAENDTRANDVVMRELEAHGMLTNLTLCDCDDTAIKRYDTENINPEDLNVEFCEMNMHNLRQLDYNQCLKDVSQNGMHLGALSAFFGDDDKIVLAAVAQNGLAIQFADNRLMCDITSMLIAVGQNGLALQKLRNASKPNNYVFNRNAVKLHNIYEVVITAVTQNGLALEFASKTLRATPEIVRHAYWQNNEALKFAGLKIRKGDIMNAEYPYDAHAPSCNHVWQNLYFHFKLNIAKE